MRSVLVGLAVCLSIPSSASAQLIQEDRVEAVMLATGRQDGLPMTEERLNILIDGQHATTTLTQVYENRTGGQTEGRYRLRAGMGAHVDGFAYWNGEQKIVGEVFEKQIAHQVYDRVTTRRRDPGLLEQDGEGAFAFKVFPIESREKKRIELRWTKWLERNAQTVRFRAPVTRGDAEIVITLAGAVKDVTSPTHKLHVEKTGSGVRLRSDGLRKQDGELIVEWTVDAPEWQPVAYVQKGTDKSDGWFAAALAAPNVDESKVAAKDVTIVVDRSGSMTGEAMDNARLAAANMIKRLDARDRLNIISFSDEVDPLFAAPQTLDADTRSRAVSFAERLRPGGGTDIALALRTAIKSQDTKDHRPRVIVFMTDGQSEAEQALDAAKADVGDARVFTLGLGKEVNKALLQRIAAVKRGRFVYVDSPASLDSEVGKLAASIAKPVLVNVSVDVEGVVGARIYPRSIPDLFAMDELLVTGRLKGTGTAKIVFSGLLDGKKVSFSRSIDIAKAPARPWVGSLWAQARIDHIQEELSLKGDDAELKNELLDLALAYNVVTPYTAFLAIPESELGDMKGTLEAARERKKKIQADNADIAALKEAEEDAKDANLTNARYARNAIDVASVAPGDADEREESDDDDGSEPIQASREVRSKGCAGCATQSTDRTGLVLLVLVVGLVLRRRRR